MIWLNFLFYVLPLVTAAEDGRRMVVRSGDLPEDYHMATASSRIINTTISGNDSAGVDVLGAAATTEITAEVTTALSNETDEEKGVVEADTKDRQAVTEKGLLSDSSTTALDHGTTTTERHDIKRTFAKESLLLSDVENDVLTKGEISRTLISAVSEPVTERAKDVLRLEPVTSVETDKTESHLGISAVNEPIAERAKDVLRLEPVTSVETDKTESQLGVSVVSEPVTDRPKDRLEPATSVDTDKTESQIGVSAVSESVTEQPKDEHLYLATDKLSSLPESQADFLGPSPSDVSSGRGFTRSLESTEDDIERRADDDARFVKIKKKILTTPRPKDNNEDFDLPDNGTDIAEPRSFYSFSTSTTESVDVKHTTSTLLISDKVIHNNLLNVIDTSMRPVEEDTTESLLHRVPVSSVIASSPASPVLSKNSIRFSEDFSSTGQSDWVPLVSEQVTGPEWSRFVPSSTGRSSTEATSIRQTANSRIRFPDEIESSSGKPFTEPSGLDAASWALATSTMTRKPFNGSIVDNVEHVSFVTPPTNAKLRERLQTALARATEKSVNATSTERSNFLLRENSTEPSINITKDQEFKNTIPDTVSDTRWRPVAMVTPPSSIRPESDASTRKSDEEATSVFDNIEYTTMFELMKITTPKVAPLVSENAKKYSEPDSSTTEKIFANVVEDDTTEIFHQSRSTEGSSERSSLVVDTTTQIPSEKRVFFDTSSSSTSTTTTSTEKSEHNTTASSTEITPLVQKLLDTLATKISSTNNEESTTYDDQTVTTPANEEMLPTTYSIDFMYDEVSGRNDVEKSADDNRTIIPNNTISTLSTTNDSTDPPVTDDASNDMVSAYLRLTVVSSQVELCHTRNELRAAILKILSEGTNTTVDPNSLVLLNLTPAICQEITSANRSDDELVKQRHVKMFLSDGHGDFNKELGEVFLRVWSELDSPLQIKKVDLETPIIGGELEPKMGGGVAAAIAISVIAGLCLILLGILFIIMKRRQKKFNYGQRCTPVSLDAYSLDSVSIRNSGRRKGTRASKRSYGNPAFDDPEIPSHPLNFAGLANFSQEKNQVIEEFSNIPQVAPRPDELPPGVEAKNRYANVIPLPETRVILSKREGDLHSDYINANYVRDLSGNENRYIAAQAPLETTLSDWWRMIWEQQVKVILMVTALQENGVEKCADYLPPNEVTDSLRLFGDFHVTLKKRDAKDKYIVSVLQLKNMDGNLLREVTHLWYVGWPDTGVPSESNSLIACLIEARSHIKSSAASTAPTLVHCSPGTGRTGVVIACDMLIRGFEQKRIVDIPRCVYKLRRCRAGAVQTREQYAYIYQVLNTYATKLTGGAVDLA